jgi:hypothetical protein
MTIRSGVSRQREAVERVEMDDAQESGQARCSLEVDVVPVEAEQFAAAQAKRASISSRWTSGRSLHSEAG